MQLCTSCHKNPASVHILDLKAGELQGKQVLCQDCAESSGIVQPKASPLKLSSEILEDLIGGLAGSKQKGRAGTGPTCPGCGMAASDFKTKGRLGCPRCYEVFRQSLVPLLERIHDSTRHLGRLPARSATARPRADMLADLRRRLEAAIAKEDYEEAADLRDQLRQLEQMPPTKDPA